MRTAPRKTLWEEGRHPGRSVRAVAVTALLLAALVDGLVFGRLSLLFDVVFVVLSLTAALAVRPRDFFTVGVLPPLMMFGAVLLLALVSRETVAESTDGLVQAVVSGLALHAGALVTGYVLTLIVLWVRQTALRNSGAIRAGARPTAAVNAPADGTRLEARTSAADDPTVPGRRDHAGDARVRSHG